MWVIQWRTVTGRRRLSYAELVEEALCFGWIDSTMKKIDDERSMITMTPRRRTSAWSRSNKDRVERMVAEGRMANAGLRAVEAAMMNGSWEALNDIDALIVPNDLVAAFATHAGAQLHFDGFTPSRKRMILHWIKSAKRADTRARRIAETARLAADNRFPGS